CSSCGLNRLDLEAGDLNLVNQGKLSEQFVGQHLLYDQPSGQAPELYYWARERCNAAAEVDYIVASGSKIIPVEVKSGKTGRLKSLQVFLQEKKRTFGLRFNSQPPALLKQDGRLLLSLPFYLIGQWRRMVETI
ncbi:MAG: DUF4143 domain-containing protein, partial [Deltaproteobacteria bacterium]|nr:DUF4143 domain-containing protein [Deltaproteobacteria bacterium]